MVLLLPRTAGEARSVRQEILSAIDTHPSLPVVFENRGVTIVAMPLPDPYIVQRGSDQTFTEAAVASDTSTASETVINANLFEDTRGISRLRQYTESIIGPQPSANWRAQGQIVRGGSVVGGRASPETYYFAWNAERAAQITRQSEQECIDYNDQEGWDRTAPDLVSPQNLSEAWEFGLGNPPRDVFITAFGGGIPVIIGGLSFGVRNLYTSDAPRDLPIEGDPGEENRRYLIQRSNRGLRVFESNTVGKVVMAIDRDNDLLYIIVQEDGITGMLLSEIRDCLILLGVDDALEWDGSDSATLVRDARVLIQPASHKNNTIPFGIGFRLY